MCVFTADAQTDQNTSGCAVRSQHPLRRDWLRVSFGSVKEDQLLPQREARTPSSENVRETDLSGDGKLQSQVESCLVICR